MIKGLFFDFSNTLDNQYGQIIINSLRNRIEMVIVTNLTTDINHLYKRFQIPIITPVIATKYIFNVINVIDYVPKYIELERNQNPYYQYQNKIDRIICTGQYINTNENFLLPFIPKIFRNIQDINEIDTMFKPNETIFHVARLHLSKQYSWNQILMIGDNYHTDMKGAIRLGMKTLLVKKNHASLLNDILSIIQ